MVANPAYDPTDIRYYDEKDLRTEAERIFGRCADCRLCVKFCGSFPKLFEAIDEYCTDDKYAEVDTKKLKHQDIDSVVDLCFQCKLCYIKCPYTPGDHDWAIDFPRLMARAKAQRVKKQGVPLRDRLLGTPDLVGRIGTAIADFANRANENSINRQLLHRTLGIHKDKKLPPFASKPFAAHFRTYRQKISSEPVARIAFFSTCYVNYNQPEIGLDTLAVMKTLGAKCIISLVVPETSAAYKILALNTEKAHNLRERALEVIKMYEELAAMDGATEETYGLEFDEAALITLGLCYLENGRFSGGAYHPILRRSDQFIKKPLSAALEIRRDRAKALMDLDKTVVSKVEALKSRGLTSPYLKSFVVARINPIRFRPKDAAPLGFDEVIERMTKAAEKINVEKIKIEDLAKSGGAPEE